MYAENIEKPKNSLKHCGTFEINLLLLSWMISLIYYFYFSGSPAVILAIFYTITYNLYKYVYDLPVDHIYGDVNNNGQM